MVFCFSFFFSRVGAITPPLFRCVTLSHGTRMLFCSFFVVLLYGLCGGVGVVGGVFLWVCFFVGFFLHFVFLFCCVCVGCVFFCFVGCLFWWLLWLVLFWCGVCLFILVVVVVFVFLLCFDVYVVCVFLWFCCFLGFFVYIYSFCGGMKNTTKSTTKKHNILQLLNINIFN